MINYIELNTTGYYGEQFSVDFDKIGDYILTHYRKDDEYNCFVDDYGEGICYYFLFEDNAKSFSEALANVAKLMRKEMYNPDLDSKDVADLARLMADTLLGKELYSNFKINSSYYRSLALTAFTKKLKGFDELLTHKGCYSSGNSVCFFGNKNMMDLIQKPEEFNRRLIAYSFKKNLVDVLKYLGVEDDEIKAMRLKLRKAALKTQIKKTEALLKKQKAELETLLESEAE